MRMFQQKGSGNIRLKCKKKQDKEKKRHLLVYVDGWTVQKSMLHEQKFAKTTRNTNFPISKQIQDSS